MRIFVEGKSDKAFLEMYLKHLDIENYEIEVVGKEGKKGGKNNITHTKTLEKQENKFLVIFDADDDFAASKNSIKSQISKINPQAKYDIFLFPNNAQKGDLEEVYNKIAIKNEFIKCFKNYENCINNHLAENEKIKLTKKSMLYAYLEACGLPVNIEKIRKKDLKNAFNLEDEYLKPLKNFLKENSISNEA